MGNTYSVMNTGSPERLEMLRARIREAEAKLKRAEAAGDGLEQCRQSGNIVVWQHAIDREYGENK